VTQLDSRLRAASSAASSADTDSLLDDNQVVPPAAMPLNALQNASAISNTPSIK
jgi:hypothetical protein